MNDYIKREDAIEAYAEMLKSDKDTKLIAEMILADVPSADVVEVVRCKDCKYGEWKVSELDNKTKGYRCAIHAVLGFDFGDNGYCSYGERKEK